jgi:PAS domain S-box-containing protein
MTPLAHTHEWSRIGMIRSAVFHYAVAVTAVAAAAAVRLALEPALGLYSQYLSFVLAVTVASRFGGRGSGLAATALSLAASAYFFLEPRYSIQVSDSAAQAGLALFAVVGTIISFPIGQLRESLISSALKSARLEALNTALEPAHAMVRTADGVITYWSQGAVTMYGWPPEEAIGRRSHDLLKTEFPEPLEKIHERLMERGNWEGELRHHRRDGSTVLVASHWSLRRDERGRPSTVVEVNYDITALRQAEKAVGESEAQFRVLANAIPQLCWMANADGWIFWYNQRWYEYTGTTPEQMEGWGWQSVHDPEVLPKVLERWKASIATGEPFDMAFPLRGADGVFRPFLTRVMPVRDSGGKVVRWFGTNTDISDLRRTEEALRESEERLRLAQQVARIGTFEWNIQTGVIRWTPELEAIYGLPPGGFPGTQGAWEQLIHPEDRAEAARQVRQAIDTGGFEAEWRVIQPNGAVRWLAGRALVFKDDSGKPLRLIGVNIDITGRKHAEEALQQKTELVNYSHDAIISADENRVIRTWNTGAEEIYGWTETEAVGSAIPQLLRTDPPALIADIDQKLTRYGRWDGELVHTRKDGKQIVVESRQVLRRNAAGLPIGILEINRDVSERKRLEDQFRQAQKLEGIGRLAGGVAHDFNNLLTVITGYAQMVLDELGLHHPLRGAIEEVSKAAARATGLTRQLLIVSRRQVNETKNIVLNDLVRDFEKMLRRLIGEDINLVLSLDPRAGALCADPGQVEQVILNLAVNARDAMPQGGKLSIETSSLLADEEFAQKHLSVLPGLYVVLAVTDTGVGMSPEVKSHLFEPFFTTKEAGKGTGLGLSTVYGIVKQSGGSIWVYSEPGQGTTFKILFPAVEAEQEPSRPAPAKVPFGSETILLAEDEPGVRAFARQTLERHGYTVLEAPNGREALELARKHTGPIHLAMADVVMPEMGGADFADQFAVDRPGVPVLFMSGYANHSGRREEMGAGYLQKPFTAAVLLTQVRAVLDAV